MPAGVQCVGEGVASSWRIPASPPQTGTREFLKSMKDGGASPRYPLCLGASQGLQSPPDKNNLTEPRPQVALGSGAFRELPLPRRGGLQPRPCPRRRGHRRRWEGGLGWGDEAVAVVFISGSSGRYWLTVEVTVPTQFTVSFPAASTKRVRTTSVRSSAPNGLPKESRKCPTNWPVVKIWEVPVVPE
jgi:hypothetical protein